MIEKVSAAAQIHGLTTQIHNFLRLKANKDAWDAQNNFYQTEISDAFNQRTRSYDGSTAKAEKLQGIRRVDFLKGCHYFAGFSVVSRKPQRWKLHVTRGPGERSSHLLLFSPSLMIPRVNRTY